MTQPYTAMPKTETVPDEFEVTVLTKAPEEVREWVESNLEPGAVDSIIAYVVSESTYQVRLTIRDERSATLTKVFWGTGKAA